MPTTQFSQPVTEVHDVPRAPADAARISFRQPVSSADYIDAAWWPRTRDLSVELPQLLDVFWTAGRDINHVTYNAAAWDDAPRRLHIDGRTIRLGAFATSDPITVRLSDPWGTERVDVLVVAPDTDPATARRALELAGHSGNPYRAAEMLARSADGSDSDPDSTS